MPTNAGSCGQRAEVWAALVDRSAHRLPVGENRHMDESVARSSCEEDDRVAAIVLEELAPYGDVATVERVYEPAAGMWFTTIRPQVAGAAVLEAAFDGDDVLFVRVGGVHMELFPLEERVWRRFRHIVRAVFAGAFSESGNGRDAVGRVMSEGTVLTFGAASIPYPGRWRHARHYLAYGIRR
jgi:hypothetical protein